MFDVRTDVAFVATAAGHVTAYEVTVAGTDCVRVPEVAPLKRCDVFAATVPANVAFCEVLIVRAVVELVCSTKLFASLVPSVAVVPKLLPPFTKKPVELDAEVQDSTPDPLLVSTEVCAAVACAVGQVTEYEAAASMLPPVCVTIPPSAVALLSTREPAVVPITPEAMEELQVTALANVAA